MSILELNEETIKKFGWIVQAVGGTVNKPGWCYTVGLEDKGIPELLIIGLDPRTGGSILNDIAESLIEGVIVLENDTLLEGQLKNDVPLYVSQLGSGALGNGWVSSSIGRRGNSDGLIVMQLLFPDVDGKFDFENDLLPLLNY